MTTHEITTIGDLKKALEGWPDDAEIYHQTVAQDGTSWTLFGTFAPVPRSVPPKAVITHRHPNLKSMIPVDE